MKTDVKKKHLPTVMASFCLIGGLLAVLALAFMRPADKHPAIKALEFRAEEAMEKAKDSDEAEATLKLEGYRDAGGALMDLQACYLEAQGWTVYYRSIYSYDPFIVLKKANPERKAVLQAFHAATLPCNKPNPLP